MNRTPEGKVKDEIDKILKTLGVWYHKAVQHGYSRYGILDYYVCMHGQFIAIEAKAEGERPTLLQAQEMADIEKNGGITYAVNPGNLEWFAIEIGVLHGFHFVR